MKFSTKLLLCALLPAALFTTGLAISVGALNHVKDRFSGYIKTEQRVSSGLMEMYAQGLQMGQALRNIVLDPANPRAAENLSAARTAYDKAFAETREAAQGTDFLAALDALAPLRETHAQAQARVVELVQSADAETVKVLNGAETPAWRNLRGELLKQIDSAKKVSVETNETVNREVNRLIAVALVLLLAAVSVAVGFCLYLLGTVKRELGGDPAEARDALAEIAQGNLSHAVPAAGGGSSLMNGLSQMQSSLRDLVQEVRRATDSITTASDEIAAGSQDLSARTESQAASLQQTASSMEELSSTVRQNADNARQANQMAQRAQGVAQQGGTVVGEVVDTMRGIQDASGRIAEIINVIDGIAFQTNILALNAAVEAARAGEQGRGFAVVASEVRSLAGRSAEAAKQIKTLISDSVERVQAGTAQVDRARATMTEVVASIQRVTDIMGEISAASVEQSQGVSQVGEAVTSMDQATQQNAALVEESAAAAMSLRDQAQGLSQLVGTFRL